MDERTFWSALEYRVSHQMAGVEECARVGMWCDGFIADALDLEARPKRIIGQAWIGFGGHNQEAWTFELLLPESVTRREEIRWSELLPAEHVSQWLTVDRERQRLVVAPGDAVDDAG